LLLFGSETALTALPSRGKLSAGKQNKGSKVLNGLFGSPKITSGLLALSCWATIL